jgi:hypothetical protein
LNACGWAYASGCGGKMFKVSERVVVYSGMFGRVTGSVLRHEGEEYIVVKLDEPAYAPDSKNAVTLVRFHNKQCHRLRRKLKRWYWILIDKRSGKAVSMKELGDHPGAQPSFIEAIVVKESKLPPVKP